MRLRDMHRQQMEVFFKRKPQYIPGRELEQQGTQLLRAFDDTLKSLDLGYKQKEATDYLREGKQRDQICAIEFKLHLQCRE